MGTLDSLSADERLMVETIRAWVDEQVRPVVRELEHADTYPERPIDEMKALGVFGLAVPEEFGGTAAREADAGRRVDMEAGMAELFASETALQIVLDAVRIHGGYGYSTGFDVERYFRDAPLVIVGEGTNEIQRGVIARQLVSRGGLEV
ncbi:hypothetical protein FNH05_15960 [Amycolatopsis rhizosphaerae]|uniref:Acyl-CoA dehydrogenase/oxidase C-terminal domain-containing protein n=1 Tax=Amycolatopsis rhizosphaerae TaxID=2053003 RepID=A0A558CNW7_9PSEU|nr:hypothetical protein FNH05_15960 [Amycolatopsis rhizosphaerae]